jgi:UDP-N-acetylglucosamine transferase subunit ALG13
LTLVHQVNVLRLDSGQERLLDVWDAACQNIGFHGQIFLFNVGHFGANPCGIAQKLCAWIGFEVYGFNFYHALRSVALDNRSAISQRGVAMVLTERRRADNALLREKIDHIQQTSQQLKDLVDQVQGQAVAWAREGKVVDLPSAELAQALTTAFAQQRQAMAHIQEDIKGVAVREVAAAAALISDEELAALLK